MTWINLLICFCIVLSFIIILDLTSELIKFKSSDKSNSVSTSKHDPWLICRKCSSSFSEFLPAPSDMFVGMDTAALRNWLIKPNFSSSGKFLVTVYISVTSFLLSFQMSHFLKSLMFLAVSYWLLAVDSLLLAKRQTPIAKG